MHEDLKTLYLGGNLVLEKNVTPDEMRNLVHSMYDCGLRLIRVYPYWAHVEETKGEYQLESYDALFAQAEKMGMKILFTFKPNSPPWWMDLTTSFNLVDYHGLEAPDYMETLLKYVEHVVNRYKSSPALLAWCVWNEPRMSLPNVFDECTLAEYRKFLRREYGGDIHALNELYFKQYSSFDEIPQPPLNAKLDMAEHADIYKFATDTLARIVGKLSSFVKSIDPVHPTHFNTHNVEQQSVLRSHNLWKEVKSTDFPGISVYGNFIDRWPCGCIQNGAYISLLRSASNNPDEIFWVTEMQGGPGVYTSPQISNATRNDLRLNMWEYIGGGAKACVFWAFTPTIRGEWSLLGINGAPTERTRTVKEIFDVIEKNRELFDGASPEKNDVYILSSETTMIHDALLGRSKDYDSDRCTYAHSHALLGAHILISKLGYTCGYVDEEKFLLEGIPQNAVLVAPSCTCLKKDTVKALDTFVKNGGTLIADSLFGWKDEHCLVNGEGIKIANEIFGAAWNDIYDVRSTTKILDKDGLEPFKPYFVRCIFENNENTVCCYETGDAAVVAHTYGKGRAMRIGTEIFRRHLTTDMTRAAEFIKPLLPDTHINGVWLANAEDRFRIHVLHAKGKRIAVLLNYSEEEKIADIRGAEGLRALDLETGESLKESCVSVLPMDIRILCIGE